MKRVRLHPLSRILLLVAALLAPSLVAAQPGITRLVTFGDSLSDSGNAFALLGEVSVAPYLVIPEAPYARGGLHFSNGETWVEQLAKNLHLGPSAGPAMRTRAASNYAVGGARARAVGAFDLTAQVGAFLGNNLGYADPGSLYVVFLGGNDVRDALAALAPDPSGGSSLLILQSAVDAIATNIATLASAGAHDFLIANAPNLGLVPAVRAQGPFVQGLAQQFSGLFNQMLAGALVSLQGTLPVSIVPLDIFGILNSVVAAPQTAGLSEVQAACITPGVIVKAVCDKPDGYLFWDGIHPTRAGHAILAREAAQTIGAP